MEDNRTCMEFIEELASSAPVPGGGGAAALTGALGVALGAMVGSLTSGKKKYAAVQPDIERMLGEAERLYRKLFALIAQDAEDFRPLAAAYSLPKSTPEEAAHKEEVLQAALAGACRAPLEIMHTALDGLRLQEEMAQKGSVMALSDAGAGAALLQGALKAASLNVFINAGSMKDGERAAALRKETEELLREGDRLAEKVFGGVKEKLTK